MTPPYSDEDRDRRRKALKIHKSLLIEDNIGTLDDGLSGSDTAEVDFTKKIHPIGHFINDRERMIEEMFTILKGEKLQRILPSILKDYTIEELKADCLVHLLGMSKKRIFAILEGRDLNSSSDSESEEEKPTVEQPRLESDDDTLEITISKSETIVKDNEPRSRSKRHKLRTKDSKRIKQTNSPPIVISDDELVDVKPLKEERRTFLKLRKERRALKAKIDKKMKKTEKRKASSLIEMIRGSNIEKESRKHDNSEDDEEEEEDKGKSLLEILELEMRARAIRALLKNTTTPDEPVPVSILNIKPEPDAKVENEINKTIAQVINEPSTIPKQRDVSSPTDDVEISEVCDILTVTIDDDDDEIETSVQDKGESASAENQSEMGKPQPSNQENTGTRIQTNVDVDNCDQIVISDSDLDMNKDKVTWSERWIESKGVKDVMKNNKLCANIRKRMRFARMLKLKQEKEKEKNDLPGKVLSRLNNIEESSVDHYNLIKSLDKVKSKNGERAEGTDDGKPISEIAEKEKDVENSTNDIPAAEVKIFNDKDDSCKVSEN